MHLIKSGVLQKKFIRKKKYFFHVRVTCSKLPSNISTMVNLVTDCKKVYIYGRKQNLYALRIYPRFMQAREILKKRRKKLSIY